MFWEAVLFVVLGGILFYFLNKKKKIKPVEKYIPVYTELETFDLELLVLINKFRKENNLESLIPEKLLTDIASGHTLYMYSQKKMSHDYFTNRVEAARAEFVSENVGYNYLTPLGLYTGYINSEGHRENLLNKNATHVGIYTEHRFNTCLFAKY